MIPIDSIIPGEPLLGLSARRSASLRDGTEGSPERRQRSPRRTAAPAETKEQEQHSILWCTAALKTAQTSFKNKSSSVSLTCLAGASGLVHFDEEGERNLDYSIYDLQYVGGITKFVPILHYESHTKNIR